MSQCDVRKSPDNRPVYFLKAKKDMLLTFVYCNCIERYDVRLFVTSKALTAMNIHNKRAVLSILILSCISVQSAFAEIEKKKYVPSVAIYSTCIPKIREKYHDETVLAAFEDAEKNTNAFLSRLSGSCVGTEHSPEWVSYCQKAFQAAKKEDWLEARNQLSVALGLKRDLQDWLVLKAVADHKTGALDATIDDLEYLCKLRREKKDGYKTIWETERGVEENPFNSIVLKSYSKL